MHFLFVSFLAFFPAPSGKPQVKIVDTTSTKITVQWKEVHCRDRNGDLSSLGVGKRALKGASPLPVDFLRIRHIILYTARTP